MKVGRLGLERDWGSGVSSCRYLGVMRWDSRTGHRKERSGMLEEL